MNPKLNPEVKAEWLKRLRSGEYTQGGGKLRDGLNRYCCLGVLCDIAADADILVWHEDPLVSKDSDEPETAAWRAYVVENIEEDDDWTSAVLPNSPSFQRWAFTTLAPHDQYGTESEFENPQIPLDVLEPLLPEYHSAKSLAELNDNGATFEQIATLIERAL